MRRRCANRNKRFLNFATNQQSMPGISPESTSQLLNSLPASNHQNNGGFDDNDLSGDLIYDSIDQSGTECSISTHLEASLDSMGLEKDGDLVLSLKED